MRAIWRSLPDWSVRVTWCWSLDQKEIKITFTAWRETINRFQKNYHEARGILLLDHPLLVHPIPAIMKTPQKMSEAEPQPSSTKLLAIEYPHRCRGGIVRCRNNPCPWLPNNLLVKRSRLNKLQTLFYPCPVTPGSWLRTYSRLANQIKSKKLY